MAGIWHQHRFPSTGRTARPEPPESSQGDLSKLQCSAVRMNSAAREPLDEERYQLRPMDLPHSSSVPILFSWCSSGCAVVNASERPKNWRPRPQSCLNVEFDEAVRSRKATLALDRLRARADAQGGDEDLEVNLASIAARPRRAPRRRVDTVTHQDASASRLRRRRNQAVECARARVHLVAAISQRRLRTGCRPGLKSGG